MFSKSKPYEAEGPATPPTPPVPPSIPSSAELRPNPAPAPAPQPKPAVSVLSSDLTIQATC